MTKEWKIGDKYQIIDDGKELTGTIVSIDKDGCFIVKWNDGQETIEDYISPMVKRK